MAQTLQQRFAQALTGRGEREVPSRSGKYRTFTRKAGGFYFLGASGALRKGLSSSHSTPVSETFRQTLLTRPTVLTQLGTISPEELFS